MRNISKKRFALLSILIVLVMLFTSACGGGVTDSDQKAFSQTPKEAGQEKNTKKEVKKADVQPLSEVNDIPEDGIISKEQFETVAGQDMQVSFVGQTDDGYRYTWTYDASKIQNPQDQNLLIDFNKDDLDDVKMSANNANDALEMTMHGKGLICPPTLTVEVPEAWQSDACLLLKEQNGELARMSDVTIQSSPREEQEGSAGGSGKENGKGSGKESGKENGEESGGESGDNSQAADLESLTAPVPGTTTLIMTVTSIDGICYIVGGITNEGKISQINDIAKASENANAASGEDGDAGSGGAGGSGSGAGAGAGSGSGSTQRGINGSSSKESGSKGSGSSKSGKSGSGSGNSGNGSSGTNKTYTCTISISCSTILKNMDNLTDGKEEFVPGNGWILKKTKVKFSQGDSVHDVLQKVCRDKGIHMESRYTPAYNSAYVEGINQLYEFDCGELSGWMYNVNGWFPNYGCCKYKVSDGDTINWVYTCDLGKDVGDNSMY